MKISKTSKYAIRILLAIAEAKQLSSREISDSLGIPYKYVGKIMSSLARLNLLNSIRGKSGGFQLALSSDEIFLSDIIGTIDSLDQFDKCLLGQDLCTNENYCAFHQPWNEINGRIINLFRNTSLEDLVKNRGVSKQDGKDKVISES